MAMTELDGTGAVAGSQEADHRLAALAPYLGEIGSVVMLAYRNLAGDISTSDLLRWCEPLRTAMSGLKTSSPGDELLRRSPRTLNRLKAAEWRNTGNWGWDIEAQPAGLDFRVLSFDLLGAGWCATLTVVYEAMTDTFVHHFLGTNRSNKVSDDFVLYVIGKTLGTVVAKLEKQDAEATNSISVRLLYANDGGQMGAAYQAALQRLHSHNSNQPIPVSWLRRHKTNIPPLTASHVTVKAVMPFSVRYKTARECHNVLVRMAAAFESAPIPRQLSKRYPAIWASLNPLKADQIKPKGWADAARKEKRDKVAPLEG